MSRKSGAKATARQTAVPSAHLLTEKAPSAKRLTAYDEAHLVIYLRLLDANAGGERTDGMLQIIFDENPSLTRDQARRAVASHLKRALWISEVGYKDFLKKR